MPLSSRIWNPIAVPGFLAIGRAISHRAAAAVSRGRPDLGAGKRFTGPALSLKDNGVMTGNFNGPFLLIGGEAEIGAAMTLHLRERGYLVVATTRRPKLADADHPFLDLC